jgi:hypothetical protein
MEEMFRCCNSAPSLRKLQTLLAHVDSGGKSSELEFGHIHIRLDCEWSHIDLYRLLTHMTQIDSLTCGGGHVTSRRAIRLLDVEVSF